MPLWNTTDQEESKPKFVKAADLASVIGVDVAEVAAGRAKGIRTPGWNKYTTYTDSQGNVRHKAYCLVAASSMTLDAEDVIAVDNLITISAQPVAVSVEAPATATFSVTAAVTSGTLTYQWQKREAGTSTWADISLATNATYTTDATTVLDDNGDLYRCIVSAANANPVTSKSAKLTVTEPA